MLKNYIKIAIRNLAKNPMFSMIHILGLTIGVASCLLIFQYVSFEFSYDRFHQQAKDIYRVPIEYSEGFSSIPKTATNHPGLGPAMKADFPEVVSFARVLHPSSVGGKVSLSTINNQGHRMTFMEDKVYAADSTFFEIFSFPVVSGNPSTMLDQPGSIVISEDMALKYFGTVDPMENTITMNGRDLKVTGVVENVPSNSHLYFDGLVSLNTVLPAISEAHLWIWPEFYTYILLQPGTDPAQVEAKFPHFTDSYMDAIHQEHNFKTYFSMQPLLDIHLKSDCANEPTEPGSQRMVYFLALLGGFILIIAWVNYINLSTSKSMERAREVGTRKVAGASRYQLMVQFLAESIILNGISVFLGLILAKILLPGFSDLVGKNIGDSLLSMGLLVTPGFWLIFVATIVLGGVVAGAYPALVLSSFRPAQIIKNYSKSSQGVLTRRLLVGFQFVLSIILISITLLVSMQLTYMNKQELGYDKEQILVVKAPLVADSLTLLRTEVLLNRMAQLPEVNTIAKSSEIPGKLIAFRNDTRKDGQDKEQNKIAFLHSIDDQFLPTYNINLIAGRNFIATDSSRIFQADNNKVLVNQVLANSYGFDNPEEAIGQRIKFKLGPIDHLAEIIGVVENYHQRSLKESYDPILFYYPMFNSWDYYSLNIESKDWDATISKIEEIYRDVLTDSAFEYFFLDEFFDRQYKAEVRFAKVCRTVAGLAIFVTCLGVFGLSALVLIRRTKEIGIRKILGANHAGIIGLISGSFLKLLVLASLISIPIIVYIGNQWLNEFAYRVGLSWKIFALPVIFLLFIILVIVAVQIYRSSVLNPVASLRSE